MPLGGRCSTARHPELPEPRQSVQMVRTGPHPPPLIATGREPAPGPRRRLRAVCGLPLAVVDHSPTLSNLGHEGVGVGVAGLGHSVHGGEVRPPSLSGVYVATPFRYRGTPYLRRPALPSLRGNPPRRRQPFGQARGRQMTTIQPNPDAGAMAEIRPLLVGQWVQKLAEEQLSIPQSGWDLARGRFSNLTTEIRRLNTSTCCIHEKTMGGPLRRSLATRRSRST